MIEKSHESLEALEVQEARHKALSEGGLTDEQRNEVADYLGIREDGKTPEQIEEEINYKIETFFNSEQGKQIKEKEPGLMDKLTKSKFLRIAALVGSVLAMELPTSQEVLGQVTGNIEKKKGLEDNYIIQPDIKRWIHFLKTSEFVESDAPEGLAEITDASKEEMEKVYEFLGQRINVWGLSDLTSFSVKLALLNDMKEKGINLDEAERKPDKYPDFMMGKGIPSQLERETEQRANSNALNLYHELKVLLK